VISIHCGSRALGHQIGADYLKVLDRAVKKYRIKIPDRELVCAPFYSEEGQAYFGALNCSMNVAYANRQIIAHRVRRCLSKTFEKSPEDLGMHQIWDVGHNTGKLEEHEVDGEKKKLVVHRKGATRAFPAGRHELPPEYIKLGQPVLVGGSMGTKSYILRPTTKALGASWGSSVHGAGRSMSRTKAKRTYWGENVVQELFGKGILVRGHSMPGIAEEAPGAYKDVTRTVRIMECAGLAHRAVVLRPIGNIKG
jgi:tRNA-splicing ligase RtcB